MPSVICSRNEPKAGGELLGVLPTIDILGSPHDLRKAMSLDSVAGNRERPRTRSNI